MKKWIAIMQEICKANVKRAKEFSDVIKKHVPNYQQFQEEINSLVEFEILDDFLDRVLLPGEDTSCLIEVIYNKIA